MTKEDYMKLPKERLAELLVERDKAQTPYFVQQLGTCPYDGRTCNNYWGCSFCNRKPITYYYNTNDTNTQKLDPNVVMTTRTDGK